MQVTLSVGLSVVAVVVSVGVLLFARQRPETPGAVPLAVFTGATAVWTAGNALQAASTTLSAKLFWVNVQYVGLSVVPIGWFAFACEYAERDEWVNRRTLAALGVFPAVLIGLSVTNQYHHLVRESSRVVAVDDAIVLQRTFGPVFWLGVVYSNLVNGVGTVLLLRKLVKARRLFRGQTLAILTGTTVPWAAATLFYNGLSPVEPEVFFSVTGVAFAVAISRYGLLDVVPVGRETVVRQMDDPVVVVDGADRVVDANPAASRLFGWQDPDTVVGEDLADACSSCPELVDRYRADANGEAVTVEDPTGDRRYLDVSFSSLADHPTSGTVLFLRDVTSRKRHERRLVRQNERLETVGRTIAHDLRNPLAVADGHLELAKEVGTEPASEHLQKVDGAHDRMEDIIDDVLDMARGQTPATEENVRLRAVAESAWANVETGSADLAFEGSEASLVADDRQLTSLFENLFRNAIDHGGPDVTVRVGPLDEPELEARAKPKLEAESEPESTATRGEKAGFYVADDGPGIPVAERERVFERGFTTTEEGTGVGLAVVGDVAETHDWEIAVTESEAGGARFELRDVEVAETASVSE
jgi:PAS domain S-box-containing protein